MKIARITRRLFLLPSDHFGVRDGKMYYGKYDTEGEIVEPPHWTSPAGVGFTNRANNLPECDEGVCFTKSTTYRDIFPFGENRGTPNKPFLSTMGITAGKTFAYSLGGIRSRDGDVYEIVPSTTVNNRTSNFIVYCEILMEDAGHFLVMCKEAATVSDLSHFGARNGLVLIDKAKSSLPIPLVYGYFDCIYLGDRKGPNSERQPTFAIMSNYLHATPTPSIAGVLPLPSFEGSLGVTHGQRLHMLTLTKPTSIRAPAAWAWTFQRKLGNGFINSTTLFGLRYQITADQSAVQYDSEGYLARFSYTGYVPELGADTWTYVNNANTYYESLPQKFGVTHLDFSLSETNVPTVAITTQQIELPQNLLDFSWKLTGHAGQVYDRFISLVSGRSWYVGSTYYCIMSGGSTGQYVRTSPTQRASPEFPLVLIKADVDEYRNLTNITFTEFPYKLGADCTLGVYLLSDSKDMVWMPDTGIAGSKLGLLDLRGPTPVLEVASLPARTTALGTSGDKLVLTLQREQRPYLVTTGTQPDVTLAFEDADVLYGTDTNLIVSSSEDATLTIKLYLCAHLGSDLVEIAVSAGVPSTVPITVYGTASAHIIGIE